MNEAATPSDNKKPIGLLYVYYIKNLKNSIITVLDYCPVSDETCSYRINSEDSCGGFHFFYSRRGIVLCMNHLLYNYSKQYKDKLIYSLEELYNICFEHILDGGEVTGIDDGVLYGVVSE